MNYPFPITLLAITSNLSSLVKQTYFILLKCMRLHSTLDKHFSLSQQIRSLSPYWAKGIFLSKIYRNNRLHVIKGYKNHIIISRLRIAIPLEGFL